MAVNGMSIGNENASVDLGWRNVENSLMANNFNDEITAKCISNVLWQFYPNGANYGLYFEVLFEEAAEPFIARKIHEACRTASEIKIFANLILGIALVISFIFSFVPNDRARFLLV
jgi:hypothetical protein